MLFIYLFDAKTFHTLLIVTLQLDLKEKAWH